MAVALSTRDKLIHAADDLFYRDGFHAVGLDRILELVGVTKTTFYNHFESKDQLIVEVLRAHDRWWRDIFMKLLRDHGGESPRGQLLALPAVLEELFSSDTYNGCIFINVAVEFPLPHDPAHIAAAEHKQAMEWIIRDLAVEAGAKDPIALAEELQVVLEGSYVTQQVHPTDRVVPTAARMVRSIVEHYLPAAEAPAA